MDLGELGGFGDVEKNRHQGKKYSRRAMKNNKILCKVAGGLGRSFGGSGLSKYQLKIKLCINAEHQNVGPLEYIPTPRSVGRPGLGAGGSGRSP